MDIYILIVTSLAIQYYFPVERSNAGVSRNKSLVFFYAFSITKKDNIEI